MADYTGQSLNPSKIIGRAAENLAPGGVSQGDGTGAALVAPVNGSSTTRLVNGQGTTTFVAKATPARVYRLINTSASAQTNAVTVADSTSGATPVIWSGTLQGSQVVDFGGLKTANGLTITAVTAGVSADVLLTWD